MTDTTHTVQLEPKVYKARTSLTLTPEVLTFVKEHADDNKISVSQLVENLILELQAKVNGQ